MTKYEGNTSSCVVDTSESAVETTHGESYSIPAHTCWSKALQASYSSMEPWIRNVTKNSKGLCQTSESAFVVSMSHCCPRPSAKDETIPYLDIISVGFLCLTFLAIVKETGTGAQTRDQEVRAAQARRV